MSRQTLSDLGTGWLEGGGAAAGGMCSHRLGRDQAFVDHLAVGARVRAQRPMLEKDTCYGLA